MALLPMAPAEVAGEIGCEAFARLPGHQAQLFSDLLVRK